MFSWQRYQSSILKPSVKLLIYRRDATTGFLCLTALTHNTISPRVAFDVPIKTRFTVSQTHCQLIEYTILLRNPSRPPHLALRQIHYFSTRRVFYLILFSNGVQDIEGLALKILESMYGTTAKMSSQGQRTVKVTLNIRPSSTVADNLPSPQNYHLSDGRERERKNRSSSMAHKQYGGTKAAVFVESMYADTGYPTYVVKGSRYRAKPGAQRYRHDQLIEMVQKSLAENLSFQNQR